MRAHLILCKFIETTDRSLMPEWTAIEMTTCTERRVIPHFTLPRCCSRLACSAEDILKVGCRWGGDPIKTQNFAKKQVVTPGRRNRDEPTLRSLLVNRLLDFLWETPPFLVHLVVQSRSSNNEKEEKWRR
jgi:hypothetical protein